MVEGGATVIATFLDMRERDERGNDRPIVDMHIVTVAPVMIGAAGVQAGALISKVRRFRLFRDGLGTTQGDERH